MSIAPPPVFKNTSPVANPDDLRIVLEKLGYRKVIELFSGMGIGLRGNKDDIYDLCAYITSWDYKKTKLLRDMYALSDDSGIRLTGFLIEVVNASSVSGLQSFLRQHVTAKLRSRTNRDDLVGFVEAIPQENNVLQCTYRYRRSRIKSSDLSVFQDVPVDTPIWVYDTRIRTKIGHSVYCVAIQPTIAAEYGRVRQELIELFSSTPAFQIRSLALKLPQSNHPDYQCLGFNSCAESNNFMTSLLENPVLDNVSVKDVPAIKMFKWDRVIETPEDANLNESQSIEDDLDHHLKDLQIDGVALQKAKTIIAAFEADMHAASMMSIIYESQMRKLFFDTEMKFRVQNDGLEVKVKKIWRHSPLGHGETLYDMEEYWSVLWDYWDGLLHRYVDAVGL